MGRADWYVDNNCTRMALYVDASLKSAILGLQGMFPLKGQAAVGVGSIEYPISERKRLAALYVRSLQIWAALLNEHRSRQWTCPHCHQTNLECLPDLEDTAGSTPVIPSSSVVVTPQAAVETGTLPVPPVVSGVAPDKSASESSSGASSRSESPAAESASESAQSAMAATLRHIPTASSHLSTSSRSPLLLDTAICVLLVLVCALLFRRFT